MEVKHRIVMFHIEGYPVNNRYEPVESLSKAARYKTIEDYERFITGFYKPSDASQYVPKTIEITYRELENDGRENGDATASKSVPS